MLIWKYTKDINTGVDSYTFDGTFYVTKEIHHELNQKEIFELYNRVKILVGLNDGVDCVQTFQRSDGVKVSFIDELSESEKLHQPKEKNYFTLSIFND